MPFASASWPSRRVAVATAATAPARPAALAVLTVFAMASLAAPIEVMTEGRRWWPALLALLACIEPTKPAWSTQADPTVERDTSEGVADEIINTLLRQSKIKVIGRTSAFQFRGDRKSEAAAALKDPRIKAAGDKLAAFLCRIQIQSESHPELHGGWFRAFDFMRWEYWASSARASSKRRREARCVGAIACWQ